MAAPKYLASPSGGDDAPSIQAAIDSLGDEGGVVLFGDGVWLIGSPLVFPKALTPSECRSVTLQGSGRNVTVLERTADVIVLDVSGDYDPGDVAHRHSVRDLTVSGGDIVGSATLVRTYYAANLDFQNVVITNGYGCVGLDMVQVWDSYFRNVRIESCGSEDGTVPSHRIACRTSDDFTPGVYGYSDNNCNFLRFENYSSEGNYAGLHVVRNGGSASGATSNNHQIQFVHPHFENHLTSTPTIRVYGTSYFKLLDGEIYGQSLNGGASATALIEIGAAGNTANNATLRGLVFDGTSGSNTHTRSILLGAASGVTLNELTWNIGSSGRGPTGALVEWSGTNNDVNIGHLRILNNADSRSLFTGAPSSISPAWGAVRQYSGAGKTTVSDSDFASTPLNGAVALARNTSDSKVYLGARVNGSWKHVELV